MTDDLLTVEEVAARLKLQEWTIRDWFKSGKLKGAKIGDSTWRMKESDLLDFIESSYKTEVKE